MNIQINYTLVASILAVIVPLLTFLWFVISRSFAIGKVAKDIEQLKESGREIARQVAAHSDNIARIQSYLGAKYKDSSSVLMARNSPRTLSSKGMELFEQMNGAEFLKTNKEYLYAIIDQANPKAALDVEGNARFALCASTGQDFFLPIKTFVYNCPLVEIPGKEPIDMDLDTACGILAIPLRDMYLEDHQDIVR